MEKRNSFGPRQMYQGNWSCSECGAEIKELPFEPDGSKPLFCKDCHRAKNDRRRNDSFGPRQMFHGNWKCSGCGAEITELPFEPDGSKPLFCRDCHRAKRNG